MKRIVLLIISITILLPNVCFSANVIGNGFDGPGLIYDRVAVVGNSNGSLFSYYNNIDRDDSIPWQCATYSNHAAGGDTVDSIVNFPNTQTPVTKSFINEAGNYDYAIMWFGTNEIQRHETAFSYKNRLMDYINKVINVNPKIKILLMKIPMGHNYAEPHLFAENLPLFNMAQEEVASTYPQVELIDYDRVNPTTRFEAVQVHLDYRTHTAIWQLIKNKYYLNVEQKPRKLDEQEWNELTK